MAKPEQSRNSWINKDEPKDVSTMAQYKDGYEDIVEARRQFSDLKYILKKKKDVPQYKYSKPRTPVELSQNVLNSDRVKYAIETLAEEVGLSTDAVSKEAIEILNEMSHSLSLNVVRGFAYFLVKVFKALFRRVYVNEEGVQRLRKMIHEYPVMLMPTHRSYMDFLLVSYIFYDYDLPLPVIAAAMDFKGMKFFGWLLRNCGAFYIRRSFGTDQLYWAIFTEYVQTQLRNGDQPLEFFVEGTRSRTAKSYVPRIGMLAAGLESYFKAELPDIMIVPISVSYDRILEESLYAYELLGIPKPKESASGVFKARSILEEDFGSVHFHICEAISIRQFSTGRIDRVKHSLEPRYINSLMPEEVNLTRDLAFRIVREQQKHLMISPWSLMAAVLMQSREGISVKQLIKETDWLKRQASNFGAYVDWPGNASSESVIRHYLGLHLNIISVSTSDLIQLKLVRPSHATLKANDDIMLNGATNLILGSYRNQLLHVFVRVAMIAITVNGCDKDTMIIDELYKRYIFLEKLLSKDFVFQPGDTKKDFDQAVLALSHSGGIVIKDNQIYIKQSINKHTTFYSQMFEPFLLGYWVVCQHLLSMNGDLHGRPLPKKPKDLAKDVQKLIVKLIQDNSVKHYEILSMDLIGNCINALVEMGAVHKDRRIDEAWISPNQVLLSSIAEDIGKYVEVPTVSFSTMGKSKKTVVLSAKI